MYARGLPVFVSGPAIGRLKTVDNIDFVRVPERSAVDYAINSKIRGYRQDAVQPDLTREYSSQFKGRSCRVPGEQTSENNTFRDSGTRDSCSKHGSEIGLFRQLPEAIRTFSKVRCVWWGDNIKSRISRACFLLNRSPDFLCNSTAYLLTIRPEVET